MRTLLRIFLFPYHVFIKWPLEAAEEADRCRAALYEHLKADQALFEAINKFDEAVRLRKEENNA